MTDAGIPALLDFPLSWRWTQESHAVLPANILATIHPLTKPEADALTGQAQALWALDASARTSRFAAFPEDHGKVQRALAALSIAPTTSVIVYWSTGLAVRTLWSTFTAFWDDFCYPSSDDVVVWPDLGSWALHYGHDEWFSFWRQAVV